MRERDTTWTETRPRSRTSHWMAHLAHLPWRALLTRRNALVAALRRQKETGRELRVDRLAPECRLNSSRPTRPERVLTLCIMELDKNEAIRIGHSYEELPFCTKSRSVVHGFQASKCPRRQNHDGRACFAPESRRSLGTTCRFEALALALWGR